MKKTEINITSFLIKFNPEIFEEDVDTQAKLIYKEQKEKKNASGETGTDAKNNTNAK